MVNLVFYIGGMVILNLFGEFVTDISKYLGREYMLLIGEDCVSYIS